MTQIKSYRVQIRKARQIAKAFGIRRAAGYLRNQGVSVEGALAILCYTGKVG